MTTSIAVDATVDQVFALFADIPNAIRIPGIVKVEMLTEGPVGTGTRFRETRVFLGKEASEELEFTAFQQGRSYTMACTSHGATHTTRFDFNVDGQGTQVELDYEMECHSMAAKVMGKTMMIALRKCMEQDLIALKALAEEAAGAAPID